MSKQVMILSALMICIAPTAPAHAAVVDYMFTAGSFNGTASIDDATNTLTAFSFNMGGKLFDLSNTALQGINLGGTLNGVNMIQTNFGGSVADNDFFIVSPFSTRSYFAYTTSERGLWSDYASFTALAPSVPEPATWAMMICGLGLVGASMRRQKGAVSFA